MNVDEEAKKVMMVADAMKIIDNATHGGQSQGSGTGIMNQESAVDAGSTQGAAAPDNQGIVEGQVAGGPIQEATDELVEELQGLPPEFAKVITKKLVKQLNDVLETPEDTSKYLKAFKYLHDNEASDEQRAQIIDALKNENVSPMKKLKGIIYDGENYYKNSAYGRVLESGGDMKSYASELMGKIQEACSILNETPEIYDGKPTDPKFVRYLENMLMNRAKKIQNMNQRSSVSDQSAGTYSGNLQNDLKGAYSANHVSPTYPAPKYTGPEFPNLPPKRVLK